MGGKSKKINKMFGPGGAVAELQAITCPTRPPVCVEALRPGSGVRRLR